MKITFKKYCFFLLLHFFPHQNTISQHLNLKKVIESKNFFQYAIKN